MERQRLTREQFENFTDYIYGHCGIRINRNKVLLLSNRIHRRLKACDLETFADYYRFLRSPAGAGEVESFLDVVTTNETFFFRTEKHFQFLHNDLIEELLSNQRAGRRPASLRIWSAGCSTGAEAYSIAICLAENSYRLRDWQISILATDISQEVLTTARHGVFKSRTMEFVTEKQRRRFFRNQEEPDLWQVRPDARQMVEFRQHNLIQPAPGTGFDCIFLCNVLIYFDQDSKQVVIDNLVRALAVGGYLIVGPSEGISGMLDSLRKVSPLIYQKTNLNASRDKRGVQP